MEKELEKRLLELKDRSDSQYIYTSTRFLTEGEQAILAALLPPSAYRLEGGHGEAERCVAVFGSEEELGYPWESTLCILRMAPKDMKFADELNHRDFLGALLNLGIKRELLGDLLVFENVGYLVALESIAPFLEENLTRVRHTAVRTVRISAMPQGAEQSLEERTVVAASPRLDALIGAVWNLSRSEAKELVEKEKVSIRGKLISDPSFSVKEGDRVSVRGCGRFYFDGETGETRSGRCRMRIRLFV